MASPFRITQQRMSVDTFNNLQKNLNRLQTIQNQMSSGKAISVPSDNPSGATDAMRYRNDINRNDQYIRNTEDGMAWLATTDSALQQMLTGTQRARDLVLQGINSSNDSLGRAAIGAEIGSLRTTLIQEANTQYLGRPVFVGTQSGVTDAYDASGAFLGTGAVEQVNRTVGSGTPVRVNVTGPEAFGTPPNDLFTIMTDIQTHMAANNKTALATDLNRLDTVRSQMQSSLSDVGARYNRLEAMKQRAEDSTLNLRKGLSEVEDIDLPKTITDLQLQEVAYQAALGASARVIQPTLVDFLR